MRFLFFCESWPESLDEQVCGSSVQVYYMVNELIARSHEVLVLQTGRGENEPAPQTGLHFYRLPRVRWFPDRFFRSWLEPVMDTVLAFAPQVVYQRGKLADTVAARHLAEKCRALFIWASNSDQSGERFKFANAAAARRHGPGGWARWLIARYADWRIEAAIQKSHLVLAQTRYQQQRLQTNFAVASVLLRSGHPMAPLRAKKRQRTKILWLANLTPVKQPHLFAELAKQAGGLAADFYMAGHPKNNELLQRVNTIAYGLENFYYLGGKTLGESQSLMQEADLFVMTSTHEGIANTFIQACMAGTPTLSLGHEPDGIITRHGLGAVAVDFNELVTLTRQWIENSELRNQAGRRAWEFARENFDIKKTIDQFLQHSLRELGS